ncbi:MAG: FHA domain-containing protein [Candidatus Binataceae bacterium]
MEAMLRRLAFGTAVMIAGITMLALMTNPAWASLDLSVGNPGLSHFDSDGAVQLDFGLVDQSGQPVGNLQPSNIQVLEDGKPAKIIDFRGVGQGRPVDIVFVMDVTESMQPYIDAIKQNMITFAHDLAANNRDYRLGLVTFEDYVVSKYSDCNCAYQKSFTSNVNQFIEWVGTLHAGGGGDIPEDQLGALSYASTLPFRPKAQAILILITDAPPHHAGDSSQNTEHDQAYWNHRSSCCVTHSCSDETSCAVNDLTGTQVASMLSKQGLTLYAVVPPPFIAPQYQQIVQETHGRQWNIITQENRFPELVREIGHSIATEYSLTYRTPRPIEDGTQRRVQLKVNYNGQSALADTAYQVRGVGGAVINVPSGSGSGVNPNGEWTGLPQLSFAWWNAAVPLLAIVCLFGLSRIRFGVSSDELKAIVEAQSQAPPPSMREAVSKARQFVTPTPQAPGAPSSQHGSAPPTVGTAAAAGMGAAHAHEARLTAINPADPIPAEFSLLKDEISLGRGEDNDVVIPHPSVSRAHARLMRRNGAYELLDLNSTNGSYVNDQPVSGSVIVANGSEVRFGDIRFVLHF